MDRGANKHCTDRGAFDTIESLFNPRGSKWRNAKARSSTADAVSFRFCQDG